MFGLFFFGVVPLFILGYVILVYRLTYRVPIKWKIGILMVAYGLPASYPFMHKYSPSYKKFKTLCSNPERVKLINPIKVDMFYTRFFGDGYRALIEQPYTGFVYEGKVYSRRASFGTDKCKRSCDYKFTVQCSENQCLEESELTGNTSYIEYEGVSEHHESTDFLNSDLSINIDKFVSKKYGVLAETYNYTFSPYGSGWATILGGSSGSAPAERCEQDARFNYYEIMPPVNEETK